MLHLVASMLLAAPVQPTWHNATAVRKDSTGLDSVCAYLSDYLPSFCDCTDVDMGAVAQCNVNVLDVDTVGVKAQFAPCANPLTIDLEITEADAGIDYPIAGITAGDDEEIPIPGLSFGIPIVGTADGNMAVKVDGNLDDITVSIGVDACITTFGHTTCGKDLTSALPVYILDGEFDFSSLCATMRKKDKDAISSDKKAEANGEECCGEQCSSSSDCAPGLFCCPNHLECMDASTKSTRGPNCDACDPPSAPSSVLKEEKKCT